MDDLGDLRRDELLAAALAIGEGLAHPAPDPVQASIYAGQAGLALFFWRLAQASDSPRFHGLALAHAEDALKSVRARLDAAGPPDSTRFGFYTGAVGPAWLGLALNKESGATHLQDASRAVLATLDRSLAAPAVTDLLDGAAGAAPALLAVAAEDERVQAMAHAWARQLLGAAVADAGRLSWPSATKTWSHPLTGLAHGDSGYAYGLAALGTPPPAVHGAWAYERAAFDAQGGDWPDYRAAPGDDEKFPVKRAWCHGAPGIGLSRVGVARALWDCEVPNELAAALSRTRASLDAWLEGEPRDAGLCHGVAGLIECAWAMAAALGDTDAHRRAVREATALVARLEAQAQEANLDSSLMLGWAGVGHLLLRLHDPSRVPTILLPGSPRVPA